MGKPKEFIASSIEEDDELSKGEFTDDISLKKHYADSLSRAIEKASRRRRKSALKAEKRMGGPPKIWSELMSRRKAMAKKEDNNKETTVSEEQESAQPKKLTKALKKEAPKKAPKKEEKSAKPKLVKAKAKEKEKTKVKAKEKEKKEKQDRKPSVIDGKITLLSKENPKRKGSNAYKKFELYKKHKTVKAYLEAGGKRSALRYDVKHGYIKLSNLQHKGDAAEAA